MSNLASFKPAEVDGSPSAEGIRQRKALLQANNAELIRRFRAGAHIETLIRAKADFIDALLVADWQNLLGPFSTKLALIAVGGYGRRELHPNSDIDLLVLLDETITTPGNESEIADCQTALAGFFNLLWDIGLKPGQSARSIDECVELARADQTVMTSLLEARLLHGSNSLFATLQTRLGPEYLWPSQAFFDAKMAEQQARYAKYHDTAYNLEPNIKEGPGGLRDIQIIGWIVKRHYNSSDLHDLIVHGWLTESEFTELIEARNFLWQVRFALHALTGRCEDRLLFEYQRELADQFGCTGQGPNEAVEQFMQRYFRTVMGLERLNEMVLQLFKEVALHEGEEVLILPINNQFQAVNLYIEALTPKVFEQQPLALLNVFLILQQNTSLRGIRASTIRLIRQHIYLIDEDFRANPDACSLFMEILRQPCGITQQLRRMNRYGILAAYLPAFGRVVGRMQYDLFHVYTVDEHTLFLIRNLRRFALEQHRADHPHCNEIFALIDKPELLYIAGLMHDIAKGSGGDHSEVGETIAGEFCQRHGLDHHDTRLVQWLVRHHLLMSMTAQRKDISDPDVIHEFASKVGDVDTLNYLYLLTIADIRATNPSLWNSWKGALLRELFTATRWAFRRGLEQPVDIAERIRNTSQESRQLLQRLGISEATVQRIWKTLPDEYFQRYLPEEIAWHTVAMAANTNAGAPLVLLRPVSQRGTAEIFLNARNHDHIFAHSTAVLDQLGVNIFDAKLITTGNGDVLNSYHVLEQSGDPIKDHQRQIQICAKLRECLANMGNDPIPVLRREARQIRHFTVPTQVYFHDDPQRRYTVLELIATDRPGLLSKVGQAFSRVGIRLYNARISTIGSRAEDIFYITDRNDLPLVEEAQKKYLVETLIELVGEH